MTIGPPSQPSPPHYQQDAPGHYAPQPGPASQPNLGLGIVVGLGAAVLGAIVWGGFTGVTHLRIGYLSIAIGLFIAWAMTKAARGHAKELGVAAAIITLVACAAGDVGTIYIKAMHEAHTSLSELMSIAGPFTVLKDDLSHDKLGVLFFALAAFFAFRYGASGSTGRRPARVAAPQTGYAPPVPVQPNVGAQPGFDAQPGFAPGAGFAAPVPPNQPVAQQPINDGYFTQPPAPGGPTA